MWFRVNNKGVIQSSRLERGSKRSFHQVLSRGKKSSQGNGLNHEALSGRHIEINISEIGVAGFDDLSALFIGLKGWIIRGGGGDAILTRDRHRIARSVRDTDLRPAVHGLDQQKIY